MMTDALYQTRMSELADFLGKMVDLADQREDFVLAAKLEDARVTVIQRRDEVAK